MKYVHHTLMPDEELIFFTRPHKIVFMPVFVWLIISLLILIYGPSFGLNTMSLLINIPFHIFLSLCAFIIAILHALSAYILYIAAEYAITNKRVLMKVGLVRRNSLEIFLDKIESIHVRQSIFGRILNYGTLVICGTGGSKDPFNYIPKPLDFRKMVQEQIERSEK